MSKIRSGRLRHYVEIYRSGGLNEYNEPDPSLNVLVFSARANVQIKRGNQLQAYGTVLTDEIITSLMYYDGRAQNDHYLVWDGKEYEIQHIAPDELCQSMIITAKVISK